MKITTARLISQIFFFILFLWFCIVMNLGGEWWQLKGWSVNLFLQLDPLVGLATLITSRTIYAELLWGVLTIVMTILLGRFFCGWVCPFGAIHHSVGYLRNTFLITNPEFKARSREKIRRNRYHPLQSIKYFILIFFMTTAIVTPSIQTGLLDPIPLVYRSVNLVLLPLIKDNVLNLSVIQRYYEDAFSVGLIFFIAVFMNLFIPRFYCRFICPLGAFFGLISRFALWRISKKKDTEVCDNCHLCERHCEGACSPSEQIRISECLLCMNCLNECPGNLIEYGTELSVSGEILSPDVSRREFVISCLSGMATIPMLRLNGNIASNWNPNLIRPPGALAEKDFLARCIKCGQCMRICPTNVIHPSGISGGLECLWTPVLNFRIGTSGCQRNCIACGYICPTAAIRPISLDERTGINQYEVFGPIKIGTAFVDQGRCLPWSMDKPCIVCQENCPVSPKAILTREHFSIVPVVNSSQQVKTANQSLIVKKSEPLYIEFESSELTPDHFSTGDYFCKAQNQKENQPRLIVKNSVSSLNISSALPLDPVPPRNKNRDSDSASTPLY